MENLKHIHNHNIIEGLDFNKLKIVFKSNFVWILVIFIFTNAASYLYLRYTKDLYESSSELKLDVKQEASEFGFREFGTDQNFKLISGEIENIQSKLFLNGVIDSLNLQVSYFSIGQLLNFELYNSSPFSVKYTCTNSEYFNIPFYIESINASQYELKIGESSRVINGTFNRPLDIEGMILTISKNKDVPFQNSIRYSFIINSREVLLSNMLNNLTVAPLNLNANTIRVAYKDNNPIKARDLVNKIDSLYLSYSYEQKNRANKQKIEWLTSELHQIETKMESFEDYFENFTLENKTSDLEVDLKKTIQQINSIDSQRFEITRRLQDLNQLIDNLQTQKIITSVIQQSFLPAALNDQLEKLQDLYYEMDRMKLSYNENTFAFRQKQNEIEAIKTKAAQQLEELKLGLARRLRDLTNAKSKLEAEFISMPDKNTQFSKNQRFYKLYEEFYLTLMQNKSEFEIAQAGSTPDFKILSTATMPIIPISPKRKMIYGIGFVAGIVLNVFLIGLLYLVNNKINNMYELERYAKVPVLGSVPRHKKSVQEGEFYVINHPRSMVSEAIRSLRTNLDFFSTNTDRKVISISSTISGEGKSFIAKNLGAVLALSKKRVVLIDLDMRKEKASMADVDQSKGISTVLIKKNTWQECVGSTQQEGLDFIPSGPQPPNPSELLLNGEFSALLEELKKHYEFIILDTPPVGLVTDGIMAMKRSDISVYIFRANYSKKEFLNNLQRVVGINKFTNMTAVLNAVPLTIDNYGYGYYEEAKPPRSLRSIFKRV